MSRNASTAGRVVTAESTIGVGSRFSLILPRARSNQWVTPSDGACVLATHSMAQARNESNGVDAARHASANWPQTILPDGERILCLITVIHWSTRRFSAAYLDRDPLNRRGPRGQRQREGESRLRAPLTTRLLRSCTQVRGHRGQQSYAPAPDWSRRRKAINRRDRLAAVGPALAAWMARFVI